MVGSYVVKVRPNRSEHVAVCKQQETLICFHCETVLII